MQELGWANGRNLRIDISWGAGGPDVNRKHAAELAALAPEVMMATGTSSLALLLQETRAVPIVFWKP
jgi:putative ABC transport system substrate-binding protein